MNLSVSDRLHAAAAPIWEKCLRHPFVTGIGDGTLDVEKFRFFMLQDYLYLFDYAKVFALGVVKARDPRLMRLFARNVDAVLGGEMNIHRAYMKRLGITEEQVLAVQPALDPDGDHRVHSRLFLELCGNRENPGGNPGRHGSSLLRRMDSGICG